MYRIALLQSSATPNRPATYSFLTDSGVTPWETELEDEALEKYCEALNNYTRNQLTLVNLIDLEVLVHDTDSVDEFMTVGSDALVVEQNDDSKLVITFDLCKAGLNDYIVGYIDEDVKQVFISDLESKGCTNVTVHPCEGIQADQTSPLEGAIVLPAGLLRLYSTLDRKDNYLSNDIIKTLQAVHPSKVKVTNKEALDKALADSNVTTIELDNSLTDDLTISRNDLTIDGENNTLTGKISVSGNNVVIKNAHLTNNTKLAKGSNLVDISGENVVLDNITVENITTSTTELKGDDAAFAINITGKNATVRNSILNGPTENKLYSMVFVASTAQGSVTLEGNEFRNLENVRNAFEFNNGYKIKDGTVIKGNKFIGDVEHTSITMMNFEPNAHVTLENNEINGFRLSNTSSAKVAIEFKGGKALFNSDDESEYGWMIVQQVGSEDYKDTTIKVNGLVKEDGSHYTENSGTGKELFCSLYSSSEGDHNIKPEKQPKFEFMDVE